VEVTSRSHPETTGSAIAYYVSAHGYGHGVRSCDIIGAINRLYPRVSVTIVSDLPVHLFENRLGSGAAAQETKALRSGERIGARVANENSR